MKKHIPNGITALNLICGCLAIIQAFEGSVLVSCYLIILAAFFDFFDGFVARMLGVHSPLGEQLDSLADVISFGLAPGIIVYRYVMALQLQHPNAFIEEHGWSLYIPILIPVFSAFRLAKFNIDERQEESFIGLPTPANALFFVFCIIGVYHPSLPQLIPLGDPMASVLSSPMFVLFLVVLFAILLVAEIPMFSLKIKRFAWKSNEARIVFLLLFLILLFLVNIWAVPIILLLYLLWSAYTFFTLRKKLVD